MDLRNLIVNHRALFLGMKSKPVFRYLIEIAGLALIYHLAARLGLQMAYVSRYSEP